jgi:hypothetical protein
VILLEVLQADFEVELPCASDDVLSGLKEKTSIDNNDHRPVNYSPPQ